MLKETNLEIGKTFINKTNGQAIMIKALMHDLVAFKYEGTIEIIWLVRDTFFDQDFQLHEDKIDVYEVSSNVFGRTIVRAHTFAKAEEEYRASHSDIDEYGNERDFITNIRFVCSQSITQEPAS